ncbi:transketolase [Thioclava indica]|uniref:Transketolase n=1 Tax=Thioclava indica TaxID=1353528 RepID=A0A074JP16_9RHOB|nr:transketolase [Thioclava indica]KEO59381.1 transketolase [Thioclava indica]
MKDIQTTQETEMANAIRALAMDAVQRANSGHPGMPMGMADVATVLFNRFISIDPSAPKWPDRDRFVLSAGHGSMLLYAIHHLLGYADMDMDQLRNFRQLGSRTAGHPEYGHADGIEVTTGPLGQGIATSVGMALAEKMKNARYSDDNVNHFTYVIAGDGCLMEGISHEAIDLAGHLGLGKLVVMWDDNAITIDGDTNLSTSTDQQARFAAAGWHVSACDGHDMEAIADAIAAARHDPRPSLIACRTIIGFGAPNKQGCHDVHGAPLGDAEIAAARKQLNWAYEPFEIPQQTYDAWRAIAARGAAKRAEWEKRISAEFQAAEDCDTSALPAAIEAFKRQLSQDKPKVATRKASQMALEVVNATLPFTVGGSADLTGSNLTKSSEMQSVTPQDFSGDYIHYGIREHGMAAAMNGIALHGGLKPYGGTFMAFADYCRPAIRLSALMGVPVTYVMTHDSIDLGEDGPTHQPDEHLASLRAIPNLLVMRPTDAVETAEAWEIAMMSEDKPVMIVSSRQNLPLQRVDHVAENLSARGAYLLRDPAQRDVTLIATGSEVEIAMVAADQLEAEGIKAAVVSAPCFELFDAQDQAYRNAILGTAPRVGCEAAIRQGWDLFLDRQDGFVGMKGFGASAPAPALYEHFGITAQAIVNQAKSRI